MKAVLVFAASLTLVLSVPVNNNLDVEPEKDGGDMKYFLVERSPGVYVIEDLVDSEIDSAASVSDLTYYFYSQRNPSSPVVLSNSNIGLLSSSQFSANKDTIFIVHGWTNDYTSAVNSYIRSAALASLDVNVFVVDWSPAAAKNYVSARGSVVDIGNFLGQFIQSLVSSYGLQLSRVVIAGHSLGAHVAGNAGAALNGRVSRIVGLDPAGPLFTVGNTDNRLDPTDAQFVQVIHTNGGLLGFSTSIGDADYFPNGGGSQPGCGIDLAGSCAHSRAYMYYAESIGNGLFTSKLCDSYSRFSNGQCNSNPSSLMGEFAVDVSAQGDYYLATNSNSPYAQG